MKPTRTLPRLPFSLWRSFVEPLEPVVVVARRQIRFGLCSLLLVLSLALLLRILRCVRFGSSVEHTLHSAVIPQSYVNFPA